MESEHASKGHHNSSVYDLFYFIIFFFFNASGQQFRGGASEQEFGTGDLWARIRHHKWLGGRKRINQ